MGGFDKEYQRILDAKTQEDDLYWTQFELDLILCIQDEYPIIYSNATGLNRHQRASKIKYAWKQLSEKFKELQVSQIKTKWRSILDNYLKAKIYSGENTVKNKYGDGTLSFLDDIEQSLYISDTTKKNMAKKPSVKAEQEEEASTSYGKNIRELLHEEIDLDNEMDIKEEVDDDEHFSDTTDDAGIRNDENDEATDKVMKTWSDEELMNATHLTKAMIDRLIQIKTRQYYMAPAATSK